jgi:topoisomerase-4 subunit A
MAAETFPPDSEGIESINLSDALEERYLAYALSTIMHRALPDVRDGMKPVQRRILFTMRLLKLDPAAGFKKCARVVGDVMGKYHPHGDQSIYDAMVRLAQDFAVRYPLVEGQGNFGNIDGDNAAAMRYTEARLTEYAKALLEHLDEDTVDFRETYDGLESEPVVLPAAVPNLLANGSTGIAVGMATSIPPHNVGELCDAALHLIKYPNAGIEKLVEFVPGPDFPTGGIITEPKESIIEAYKTGKGGFRLRAKWEREDIGRGGYVIVITQMPYQVPKSRLIEKIAEMMLAKKLPLLGDIRDESAEDVRLVLEPKSRTVDPVLLMESLFKITDLEVRISINMNVLSLGQIPNVLNLREVLRQWLDHRQIVLIRRTNYRLEKIDHRLEVLGGYLVAYLNLDDVIRIIRFEDRPKQKQMSTFELTDIQAEAILNMRLRALRKLEELEIKREFDELTAEREELRALVGSDELQWKTIAGEIRKTRKAFGKTTALGERRSQFAKAPEASDLELEQAMIEKEPVTIICSEKGWIRTLRGHLDDTSKISFKKGDSARYTLHAQTTDKLILLATNGKFFTIAVSSLPGGRGHGEPVRLMVDIGKDQDITALFVHKPGRKLLIASTAGNGFIVAEDDVIANTRKGKQVLNVKAPDEALVCTPAKGDHVAVIGENRKLLIFPAEQLNQMTRGRGVRLQKYKDGGLSDAKTFDAEDGLTWINAGRTFTVKGFADWLGNRAQAGRMPPNGFPKSNRFGCGL